LKLKIRALSAEGRMSAVALSATPFVLIGIIQLVAPSYFAATNSSPLIVPAIALGTALLVVGNILMYRMVNFKY
jgi:tight adherence protein B